MTAERIGQNIRLQRPANSDAIARPELAELLKQPLSADGAVRVALLNNRGLRASLPGLRSPPGHTPESQSGDAACVRALSHSATVALVGIFATGVRSAWRVLERPEDLAGTPLGNPYSTTLFIKVGLVLGAAALGGFNRFVVMPSLLRPLTQAGQSEADAGRRFARVLQVEPLVLMAVLVAAAFLTSTSPPMAA